ncbi:MAG: glycosyltransferase family 4 protein [Candidatus Competibacteraceae bacterium]
MSRILYAAFDRVPAPKGASRHIAAFLGGLVRAGLVVDACLLTTATRFAGARCLPSIPAEGHLLQRAMQFGRQVRHHAEAGGYDLIHFRSLWEGLALLDWPNRPPLLFEVNGLPSIEWPETYPALHEQPELIAKLRRQEQTVIRSVDALITPSVQTAKLLSRWGGQRLRVIPNGVDPAEWALDKPVLREPEILYMGTFSRWQGLLTLVEAFAGMPPPWRLRLVGTRSKGEGVEVLRTAQRLGVAERVLIQPPVSIPVLARLLARARLCVAPLDGGERNRRQGACPIKILEYLAAGCPVVASRLPLVEDLVKHGESAWLVPSDDPQALRKGMQRVLQDEALAARLRQVGLRLVDSYGWNRAIEGLLQTYRELGVAP